MTQDLSLIGWSLAFGTKASGYSVAARRATAGRVSLVRAALFGVVRTAVGLGLLILLLRMLSAFWSATPLPSLPEPLMILLGWGSILVPVAVVRFVHWYVWVRFAVECAGERDRLFTSAKAVAYSFCLDLLVVGLVWVTPGATSITSMTISL